MVYVFAEKSTGYNVSFDMPDYEIPRQQPDAWYTDRGYASSGILVDGLKNNADIPISAD